MSAIKTLEECVYHLKNNLIYEDQAFFNVWVTSSEEDAVNSYHHTLGQTVRNDYKLWDKEGPLSSYFDTIGIHHADDMSGIILRSLHREENNKEWNLLEQVKEYKKFWRETIGINKYEYINKDVNG